MVVKVVTEVEIKGWKYFLKSHDSTLSTAVAPIKRLLKRDIGQLMLYHLQIFRFIEGQSFNLYKDFKTQAYSVYTHEQKKYQRYNSTSPIPSTLMVEGVNILKNLQFL